ncbi:MAG: NAD(P)-dependent oxidoreductase [Planctomycetota bacterium]|nr:NAD(P)-dependent oxidoreductase [Planctomycetota bacterium]
MKVLVVGAAGHVGSIILPSLEARHDCRYFDLRPVRGREAATVVGSVNDPDAVAHAVAPAPDAVVYLAMGVGPKPGPVPDAGDLDAAFDVNVRGAYRFLDAAMRAGARRFIYASTMNVHKDYSTMPRIDDTMPTTAWEPYGMSKRVGEFLCQAAAVEFPGSTVIALRLIRPRHEREWAGQEYRPEVRFNDCNLGPNDTRRLFLAALDCGKPGAFALTVTGDMEQRIYDHAGAHDLLGWLPENN